MTTPEPPERRPDQPADSEHPTEQLPPEDPNRSRPASGTPNAGAAAPSPRGSRLRSRRTWLVAAAGLVAVLVVGAIGFGIGRHAGHGPGFGRAGWHDGPGHARDLGMGPDGSGGPGGAFGGPDGGFGPGGFGPGGDRGDRGERGDRGDRGDRWGPGRRGGMANTAMLTGSVVSVAPDNLVVAPDGGAAPVTVPTNDRTRARGLGNGLTGLQPGQRVIVRIGGDKAAVAVFSPQARAVGTITALNGDRAVLVRPDGLTENVDLAAANPKPVNGDLVAATGTSAENGATLKVTELRVLPKAS